jgi:hypothetical protein
MVSKVAAMDRCPIAICAIEARRDHDIAGRNRQMDPTASCNITDRQLGIPVAAAIDENNLDVIGNREITMIVQA